MKLSVALIGKKGKCPKCGMVNEITNPAGTQQTAPVTQQQPTPPQQPDPFQQQIPSQQPAAPQNPLGGMPQATAGPLGGMPNSPQQTFQAFDSAPISSNTGPIDNAHQPIELNTEENPSIIDSARKLIFGLRQNRRALIGTIGIFVLALIAGGFYLYDASNRLQYLRRSKIVTDEVYVDLTNIVREIDLGALQSNQSEIAERFKEAKERLRYIARTDEKVLLEDLVETRIPDYIAYMSFEAKKPTTAEVGKALTLFAKLQLEVSSTINESENDFQQYLALRDLYNRLELVPIIPLSMGGPDLIQISELRLQISKNDDQFLDFDDSDDRLLNSLSFFRHNHMMEFRRGEASSNSALRELTAAEKGCTEYYPNSDPLAVEAVKKQIAAWREEIYRSGTN